MEKRFSVGVSQEQYEMWKKTLPLTEYDSMSAFIREIMDMVCECVNDMTKEVLIWVSYRDENEDEEEGVQKYVNWFLKVTGSKIKVSKNT